MLIQAEISGLEDHLGYWIRYVSNQVSHAFSLKLSERDVTVAEWVMLRELYEHHTMIPSVLAERLGMTRGAISKLAERLLAKELVTRVSSTQDRRYQDLALTDAGRHLVPELSALADLNDVEFFGHLTSADRATLERTLKELVRKLGPRAQPVN